LQKKHTSVPHNPDISNAFFRIGYVEAWGRGIKKMNEQCEQAGLPLPLYYYESSGFWVVFRKNVINEEDLRDKGLNERQIKSVMYVKEKGKITNSEYQTLNSVSKRTATNDLSELTDKYKLLNNVGFGAGSYYEFIMGQ
jgi:ATP-dependent DNA helicase RecG